MRHEKEIRTEETGCSVSLCSNDQQEFYILGEKCSYQLHLVESITITSTSTTTSKVTFVPFQ